MKTTRKRVTIEQLNTIYFDIHQAIKYFSDIIKLKNRKTILVKVNTDKIFTVISSICLVKYSENRLIPFSMLLIIHHPF